MKTCLTDELVRTCLTEVLVRTCLIEVLRRTRMMEVLLGICQTTDENAPDRHTNENILGDGI